MGIGPQDSRVDKDPDPELFPWSLLFPFFETVVSLSCPGCLWTHFVTQARPWTCHLPTLSHWDDWFLSTACLMALSLPNCLVIKQWVNVVVLLVQSCCCGFFRCVPVLSTLTPHLTCHRSFSGSLCCPSASSLFSNVQDPVHCVVFLLPCMLSLYIGSLNSLFCLQQNTNPDL